MKETRQLAIKDRVFTLPDLQRIAGIFEDQYVLAQEAGDHSSVSYTIDFADDTTIEADKAALLSEELFARPVRPMRVEFSCYNYKRDRRLSFSISHGERGHGNSVRVAGDDGDWVAQNFLRLKEAVETARPQFSAPRRYRSVILHPIALGIGSLGQFGFDVVFSVIFVHFGVFDQLKPLPEDSTLRATLASLLPILYVVGWVWRWVLGMLWGAFAVRSWLLSLWPPIEFEFGPAHHYIERRRRQRLLAVSTLVVVPIAITILYDLIRYAP